MDVALGVEAGANRDDVGIHVEHVGDYLRGDRLMSLALRDGADADDDLAIDIELDVGGLRIAAEGRMRVHDARLAEVVGAGIERRANPDADPASFSPRLFLLLLPLIPTNQVL